MILTSKKFFYLSVLPVISSTYENFWEDCHNASIHKKSLDEKRFARRGKRIVYLPPYSPELNPIEHMWSKMKSILRKIGRA